MTRGNGKRRPVRSRLWDIPAAAVLVTLGLLGLVIAADSGAGSRDKARTKDSAEPTEMRGKPAGPREVSRSIAGVIVSIDPATGKLKRPTPEEARQLGAVLDEMVSQSAEGLVVVHHFNGMMSVSLEDRFQNVAVARANSDGSIALGCVSDPRGAEVFVQGGPAGSHARGVTARAPAPGPAKNAAGTE